MTQTTHEARQPPPRTVIYARYSSDLQSAASITDQVHTCSMRIKAEGWHLGATYSDEGISGATALRPGYQAEAVIARRIFRDYAAGASPRAIAHALNRESVPGPSGKAWGPSTINGNRTRGTGILNNELYIGKLVWNRLRYVKDPMILHALEHQLMDPDLFKLFVQEFQAEVNRLRQQEHAEQDRVERDLSRLETRIANLVGALADGMTSPAITVELARLESEQAGLLKKKADMGIERKPLLYPNLAEIYRAQVADLKGLVGHGEVNFEAMDRLRSLIDKVVVTPNEFGLASFTLVGDIAAMLELSLFASKKPAPWDEDGLEQVKLVAGVGFEPTTFRL